MEGNRFEAPANVRRVLAWIVGRDGVDDVLGDLEELCRAREARTGIKLWYWLQVTQLALGAAAGLPGRCLRALTPWDSGWVGDVRFALRSFAGYPLVTAAILLTLALGIGANAAIFSVVDAVMIRRTWDAGVKSFLVGLKAQAETD